MQGQAAVDRLANGVSSSTMRTDIGCDVGNSDVSVVTDAIVTVKRLVPSVLR